MAQVPENNKAKQTMTPKGKRNPITLQKMLEIIEEFNKRSLSGKVNKTSVAEFFKVPIKRHYKRQSKNPTSRN